MRQSVAVFALLIVLTPLFVSSSQADEACAMLESADAESVFGSDVERVIDETIASAGITYIRCRYRTVANPVRYMDLSLTRYESAEQLKLAQEIAQDENDEPVADLGERALWHKEAGSLSLYFSTEELTLHVFDQPDQVSKEEHIALMRKIVARR